MTKELPVERKNWVREELILAINLYCKMPFGKMHSRNPDIIHLANLIGRTPGSIARKLGNFASFDPSLQARGIGGLPNTGKLDKEIWNEFYNNWDECAYQSELLRAKYEHQRIETLIPFDEAEISLRKGLDRERLVKTRVNQYFFRSMILATYNYKCCITGINQPELLVAGHIARWSDDEVNRMNPRNGLCLSALHDKAFENHLLTITPEYKILISEKLKKGKTNKAIEETFLQYEGKEILLPDKFLPFGEFLKLHNEKFIQSQ